MRCQRSMTTWNVKDVALCKKTKRKILMSEIIFDSNTPENIIRIISPDVLVKGGDYNLNNIIGAQYVIDNGGDVKIVPLTPGYSTTSIIKSNNR